MKKLIDNNKAKLSAMVTSAGTTLTLATANAYAAEMNYLEKGAEFMSKAILIGGGIWTVLGIIKIAMSLNDHNGQQMKDGVFQALGGAMVVAVATWFTTFDFTF